MIRKRRKKSKNYFTQETEDYIVKYNSLDPIKGAEERSKIYENYIHYAFFKLTQNIIHFNLTKLYLIETMPLKLV